MINKIFRKFKNAYSKESFSQSGEDLIVKFIFETLKIDFPTYLDIGAHHPCYLSNTYSFYKNGCTGVCIEPDPYLFKEFKRRKRDVCLNVGIAEIPVECAKFYIMSVPTLNTFSREEALRYESYKNVKIIDTINISLQNINNIIENHFTACPNFISIDVEGYDLEILKSIDFNKWRPEVFIIETLTYTEDKSEIKLFEIIEFMKSKNYMVYADTYINTIFVEFNTWNKR
jgi:FkbM family methyltransferase